MILSDGTIEEYIEEGRIVVEPEPREEQIQPSSLDLRIGPELYDLNNDQHYEFNEEVRLSPNQPYLGHTIDRISLPNDISARVYGRSSVGRRGVLVHFTAGLIDPGFDGEVTLELYNFRNTHQRFRVGERVAQVEFRMLDEESSGYDGSYQGQKGITLSK